MNCNRSLMNFLIYENMRKILFFISVVSTLFCNEDIVRKEPRKKKVFFNKKTLLLAPE
jgi:hypothetical protein